MIIDFEEKRKKLLLKKYSGEKEIDINDDQFCKLFNDILEQDDPCSVCPTKKGCCTTCKKAEIWWNKVANRLNNK